VRVAIIGFGNLGKGFIRTLEEKTNFLRQKYGLVLKIVAVVDEFGAVMDEKGLNLQKLLGVATQGKKVTDLPRAKKGKLAASVVEDVDADVVLELTPTNIETGEPGLGHIKAAMKAGRHVITSNKGPLVVAFQELASLAKKQGVEFRYSASVGGAIPVIELARKLLAGNEVLEIQGVLNGTTNYLLTRMGEEGAPFEMVLREAQELGVAEKDPTLDVEGVDTACKIVILANSILGLNAKLNDVKRTGIRRIGPDAIELAKAAGQTIKLIGLANRGMLEVAPRLVSRDSPLDVGGTLNAVAFKLDLAREISIAGFGAGPRETSSSLLGDLIDLHRTIGG
jgi:homoserine dehydrogenase